MRMNFLLTGGGTAGHVNPALAIAETVKRNCPNAKIVFVGVKGKKEEDLIPRAGFELLFVESAGFQSKLPTPANIRAAYLALTSPYAKETKKILDDFQPDIVIGTGGYACWPIMCAAARRGIPTALHESNSHPGKTVRRLEKRMDRIWTNFSTTAAQLKYPDRVLHVGNPLRGDFSAIDRQTARRRLGLDDGRTLILSFGGSGGAASVNTAAINMMKELSSKDPSVLHIHATGKNAFDGTIAAFKQAGLDTHSNCIVMDYIYDMPIHMAAADLVICRAGAMTLSELALMKKASILIPSPNVAYNHQYLNAKELADAEAAVLLGDAEAVKPMTLSNAVKTILSDRVGMKRMEQNISAFATADANKRIWEDIQEILEKNETRKRKREG